MARPFRFGIQLSQARDRKAWIRQVQKAADLGFSTVFMPDHFGEQLAPIPALMAAAEVADIRIGTLVLDNDYRHPVVVAKEAATLDLLTEGRLELGIGAGWLRDDYDWSGIPYDPPAVRVSRFEEGLIVLKGAFGDGPFSFDGEHYTITNYEGHPKPVHEPHPPILIGAGGRRMLGIAGRHADIVGINPNLKAGAVTPEVGKDATAEATERKLGWLREAAGDRFDAIELNVLVYVAIVTDDREGAAAGVAPAFGLTTEEALGTPHALVGTVDDICEVITERRERFGFSYYSVGGQSMDDLAPVVSRLAGT